jgi:hypothetical protein
VKTEINYNIKRNRVLRYNIFLLLTRQKLQRSQTFAPAKKHIANNVHAFLQVNEWPRESAILIINFAL